MTILNKKELQERGIVYLSDNKELNLSDNEELNFSDNEELKGWNPTTYDSTIGKIINESGVVKENSYSLNPRGIVWIISKERFKMPNDVTGLTTLRTTWTRKGILTLTVGIVDPGYDGHLSTAVINFGSKKFNIKKGDRFFRTTFIQHNETEGIDRKETTEDYENSVKDDTSSFSESFLTMDTLATELSGKIWGIPSLASKATVWAIFITIVITLFSLSFPPLWGWLSTVHRNEAKIEFLLDNNQTDQINLALKYEQLNSLVEPIFTRINELEQQRKNLKLELDMLKSQLTNRAFKEEKQIDVEDKNMGVNSK